MSAVDVNARLTDAEREALVCALSSVPLLVSVVEAILRDRLPEATTFTEWAVRSDPITGEHTGAPRTREQAEKSADRLRGMWERGGSTPQALASIRLVRRTVTRHADHYGPWEQVPE